MKPPAFEYHLATTVDEVVETLSRHGPDVKVLAGGQSLVPLLALRLTRVDHLVDINRTRELTGIRVEDGLRIGAMTRLRHAERSPEVAGHAPLLGGALRHVGHAAIRNRGTVGGSIAHADPAAELPATLLALDGCVVARSTRGARTIDATDLFTGFLTTSVHPDELLTEIVIPPWKPGTGWSVQEFARRDGDFALSGAMTVLSVDRDARISQARIALFGVASTAIRAVAAEKALTGEFLTNDLWSEAAELSAAGIEPPSDLHGTSAYRRHLTRALVRRSLAEAASRIEVPA